MNDSNFRDQKFVKRYEYSYVDLQTPLITVLGADNRQTKDNYRFVVDNSSEANPIDWYNAYLEVNSLRNSINCVHNYDDHFFISYSLNSIFDTQTFKISIFGMQNLDRNSVSDNICRIFKLEQLAGRFLKFNI